MKFWIAAFIISLTANYAEASELPKDISSFSEKVDTCIHFSGEEGVDAKRIKQIDSAIQKNCSGLKQEAPRLRAKYYNNPAVTKELEKISGRYKAAFAEAL